MKAQSAPTTTRGTGSPEATCGPEPSAVINPVGDGEIGYTMLDEGSLLFRGKHPFLSEIIEAVQKQFPTVSYKDLQVGVYEEDGVSYVCIVAPDPIR